MFSEVIAIVELKISGEYEQSISIEKNNKIKIIDYKTFLNFYKYFYLKKDLFIQNKEVTKKDCIIIDVTSINALIKQMEYSKGTLMNDYISLVYGEMSLDEKQTFYSEYLKQVEILKEKLEINSEIITEDNIDKVILQNIEVDINFDNIFNTFNKILNKVMKDNINKNYIIFYNSKILNIELENDNYYLFDINQFLDIKDYNLLITEDINEFDESSLISYIENLWPLAYEENEISFLVEHYFKYLIYLDNVNIANDKLYLVGLIIKKNYKLDQKITCTNPNLSNIIKSFIDTI